MTRTRVRSTPPSASRKPRTKRHTQPVPTIAASVQTKFGELTMLDSVRVAGTEPISVPLKKLRVFRNLSGMQRQRLSELVMELYAQGHPVKWFKEQQRERKQWASEGPKRLKALRNKISKARTAVETLIDYLTTIGIDDDQVSNTLRQALLILDSAGLPDANALTASLGQPARGDDAMVTLYDFFKECGFENAEAEVRVCQIGNYLWDWDRPLTIRYSGGENWKGCGAVRKAVARRNRTTTDTPPPNR